ncbi:ATP-binding protein [Rhodococcus opacus]|uniref:ATP-binding protein n=1 Tax=Rhodococcus opacus TaxID=37919 RepID=UPI0024B94195|nr:ATP-binding protein [Rhodococcus opacus]MDJ0417188.1 ATP-binding protein [Rhodococcus opacus]
MIHPGQRRLARVQVVNWGTLHGHHDLSVARKGFLITGNSGSGKSTLIDAISAVLVPGNQLRFNAAAQEATNSGRNFVTYIRGAWRREAGADTDGLVASYLRTGATWSAIALTYRAGTDDPPITLVKLMHLGRGHNAAADVTHLHLILEHELDLTDFTSFTTRGIDTRAIRKRWPESTVSPAYGPFARSFRSRLGISSEGAQRLLHRTLSAKSLGSLDQLFRDYMLDTPNTFTMAERAVNQFHDLQEAHRVVVDARRQVEMLAPLVDLADTRQRGLQSLRDTDEENAHLGAVHAEMTLFLLRGECTERHALTPLLEAGASEATAAAERARQETLDLTMKLEGIGGGRLATLHAQRDAELKTLARVRIRRQQIAEAVSAWEGTVPETSEEFARLRGQLEDQARQATTAHEERHGARYALAEQRGTAQKERAALITDREIVARRRSNIDPTLLRARESICSAAGVPDDAVPFAGELIAVRDEYSEWTGPIERVLGGLGRTLLVPDDVYPAVAAAVDATHLGARLVYRRVRVGVTPSAVPKTGALSLVRRVEVADGPLAAWIHHHLADRYDYACVDTAAEFTDHAHAVTRAGQVKHSAERHEKDDRSRIDDRRRWVLGFDNEAKLEDIRRRIADLDVTIAGATSRLDALDREDQQIAVQNRAAQTVLDAQWVDVDVSGAQAAVDAVDNRLESWQQDNPEHSAVSVALELAKKAGNEADAARRQADTALTVHRTAVTELETRIARAELDADDAAPDAVAARIRARFQKFARRVTSDNIDKALFEVGQGIGKDRADAQSAVSAADASIVRILSQYLARWESRGGELRIDAEYVDDALTILQRLRSDGLPRYEDRFFQLLHDQSHRNIGELARTIRKAPAEIRSRIDPVNDSLHRSAFDTDRWLRIDVRERRSPAAADFLDDLTRITSGGWDIEQRPAAEERFERMAAVLERLASKEPADQRWQRQVLDTRLHVGFIGVEVDGAGEARNYHDSSSGLSGGQAQKLVFFCLAAALRYQLAPDGADLPRYGTVILDEAFDRADSAYTRRALDVFAQFGFHMVLATPLKLLGTLEEYIGGAVTVSIRDRMHTELSLIEFDDVGTT